MEIYAAVVSLYPEEQNGPDIAAQVLIYPVTIWDIQLNPMRSLKKGLVLDRDLNDMVWQLLY